MDNNIKSGITFDGYVFNDVELSLLESDRRKKFEFDNKVYSYNYISFDNIEEDIKQFVLDVKTVAKALCDDKNALFNYFLCELMRYSDKKIDVKEFKAKVSEIYSGLSLFNNFDYVYYESKLRNFYVGILNEICRKRHLIVRDDENLGDKKNLIELEQLKSVIDFILGSDLIETFELNGDVVSICHVNDVIRKRAQEIKEQLEKDIVVVSKLDDYRENEFSVAERVREKREKYWTPFSDSKLDARIVEEYEKEKSFFDEEAPYQYGPCFWPAGYSTDKYEYKNIMIDGREHTIINRYVFEVMLKTAKYNYYVNRIPDDSRKKGPKI